MRTADLPRLAPVTANRPPARVVHLGLGAFFRAHGALYFDDLGGYGIRGVSLRSPGIRDRLAPQGYAYTAVEMTPEGLAPRHVDLIHDVLVAPEDPAAVIAALAAPETDLVTLTITEKGYCHDPATGRMNRAHPDIVHDIAHDLPRSAPGFLVRALALRRARGLAPFTVLSCDNLPANGYVISRVVTALARAIDRDLATWIADHGAFPSSMVDRIVPATTQADIDRLAAQTGQHDAAPVLHEPFRQWVIEDRFVPGTRAPLDAVGVQFTTDIAPFEDMKLRLLNGAHSALAYLGSLAGHRTVAEAATDPAFAAYLRHLWRAELIPTIAPPPGTNARAYTEALLTRFTNPAMAHALQQIAMDGSQKLPPRLLAPLAERLDAGLPVDALLLAVAGWMRFVTGLDDAGRPLPRDDTGTAQPLADPRADALRGPPGEAPVDTVARLLALPGLFDPALAARIAAALTDALTDLATHGTQAMLARVTG